MGTYDGMAVPLSGGYTAYASDGATVCLTVNPTGTHDFTWTAPGADYFISVSVTQSVAQTATEACFYGRLSETGGRTGGHGLPFFADLELGGTITGNYGGMYIYISESSTAATLTNSSMYGVTVNFESFASQGAYRAGFWAMSAEPTTTNAQFDAALFADCRGATGTWGALVGAGGSTLPNHFLHIQSSPDVAGEERMFAHTTMADISTICVASLKVLVGSTTYRIPLVADSCA